MFKKILVANRGEIAVRVIRACRDMAIRSVAVYSKVDREALHVRMADEAYLLGPAPPRDSYLNIGRILEIAKRRKAEAIHPGYGFLAESAAFARACLDEGLVFIGPGPEAQARLGRKTEARQIMQQAGVPVVPGGTEPVAGPQEADAVASGVGYPVMLKAVAGGGGKGMRLVRDSREIEVAFLAAASEAELAFGDGGLYVEKGLEAPRHVEIQILADNYGDVVYLGERECSIQRRHQKLVEESPSPVVDEVLRREMGGVAVRAAKAVGYNNAGTVEFLLDSSGRYYFLEVNARLQVEHPVTEMLTGMDLVREQIRIAAGQPLGLAQEQIHRRGHAIEFRMYAEDPFNQFFPSPGLITFLREPSGPGVRVDTGVHAGMAVPVHYDPLIAKLVVWGSTRREALARAARALREYYVAGVRTTIPFHRFVVGNPSFISGNVDTGFVECYWPPTERASPEVARRAAVATALAAYTEARPGITPSLSAVTDRDPWKVAGRQAALRRW